jgi:hypothetical protein
MRSLTRVIMVMLLLMLALSLSALPPVQAAGAWDPGFYTGWISFSARIDSTIHAGSLMDAFVIEKYEGRGQVMIKIDDHGMGGASIVVPTAIDLLDYGKITISKGSCTFSSSIVAQSNYVHLRNTSADLLDTFQVPLNLLAGLRHKSTHAASFGELQGCDKAGESNLRAMKTAMRATTSQIQALSFTVKYNTGASAGGSCSIPGWEKTTPIPNANGQGVRSLPRCNWRVFKTNPPQQQKGWK